MGETIRLACATGGERTVARWDPLRCLPTGGRVRFLGEEPDGMVRVADNAGRELPDLWHPSQLRAL